MGEGSLPSGTVLLHLYQNRPTLGYTQVLLKLLHPGIVSFSKDTHLRLLSTIFISLTPKIKPIYLMTWVQKCSYYIQTGLQFYKKNVFPLPKTLCSCLMNNIEWREKRWFSMWELFIYLNLFYYSKFCVCFLNLQAHNFFVAMLIKICNCLIFKER